MGQRQNTNLILYRIDSTLAQKDHKEELVIPRTWSTFWGTLPILTHPYSVAETCKEQRLRYRWWAKISENWEVLRACYSTTIWIIWSNFTLWLPQLQKCCEIGGNINHDPNFQILRKAHCKGISYFPSQRSFWGSIHTFYWSSASVLYVVFHTAMALGTLGPWEVPGEWEPERWECHYLCNCGYLGNNQNMADIGWRSRPAATWSPHGTPKKARSEICQCHEFIVLFMISPLLYHHPSIHPLIKWSHPNHLFTDGIFHLFCLLAKAWVVAWASPF